jgi:hypothetical protein
MKSSRFSGDDPFGSGIPSRRVNRAMAVGLRMSQPKNAEPPAAARRVPSTYASEGCSPEPAIWGDLLQSAVYCDFETVLESATLRLKEEQRSRTFVDLERIVDRLPYAVLHSKSGPREVKR